MRQVTEKKTFVRKAKALMYKIRRKRINHNLLIYIVMVLISMMFWYFNKMGSTITADATFNIEYYGLPSNSILVPGVTTEQLRITLSARGAQLLAHRGGYSPIRLDLSKLDIRTFPESDSSLKFVTDDDIRAQVELQMPADYKFITLKPDTIMLDFSLSRHSKVPVVLDYDITFENQYRFSGAPSLQPDSVVIDGSAIIVDTVTAIHTEMLSLQRVSESSVQKVRLVMPPGVNCPLTSTDATVNVEKFTENAVEVPIRLVNVPDTISLRIFSQNATIRYHVGWSNYKKVSREMFAVEVDYNDLNGIKRPKFLPVRITKIPEDMGVTNVTVTPEAVEYMREAKDTLQWKL